MIHDPGSIANDVSCTDSRRAGPLICVIFEDGNDLPGVLTQRGLPLQRTIYKMVGNVND